MRTRALFASLLAVAAGILVPSMAVAYDIDCFDLDDTYADSDGLGGSIQCFQWFQGDLYAGGLFTRIAGVETEGIAMWDGTSWTALPLPLINSNDGSARVEAMCVYHDYYDGGDYLVCGGLFDVAGGVAVRNVARWDGAAWTNMSIGFDRLVSALVCVEDSVGSTSVVMAGGSFADAYNDDGAGGEIEVRVNHIALYGTNTTQTEGSVWQVFNHHAEGLDGNVFSMAWLDEPGPIGQVLAVGGEFSSTVDGSVPDMNGFAVFRGDTGWEAPLAGWEPELGPDPKVLAMTMHDGVLILGGDLDYLGQPWGLWVWDGTLCYQLDDHVDGIVRALGSTETLYWNGPYLYVGGDFNVAYDAATPEPMDNIGIWAGPSGWFDLCPGTGWQPQCTPRGASATVQAILPMSFGGQLVDGVLFAGAFDTVAGRGIDRIAAWQPATPVSIVTNPADQTVCVGDPVSFSVAATGRGPLSYQWWRSVQSQIEIIPGATSSTYTIPSAVAGDGDRYYFCRVTGACGDEDSAVGDLIVDDVPNITEQPVFLDEQCAGSRVRIRVSAEALSPLSYEWFKDDVAIPDSDYFVLFLDNSTHADDGVYHCQITSACGSSVSQDITLSLFDPPVISVQPQSQIIRVGDPVTLSVTASGSNLSYQWRKGGVPLSGEVGTSYSIAAVSHADAAGYDVSISNLCSTIVSAVATLSTVDNQAPSAVVVADATWGYAPLNVNFDGSGSSDPEGLPLMYEWDFGDGTALEFNPTANHDYLEAGLYTANLTVTDDLGLFDTDTLDILVTDLDVVPAALDFGQVALGDFAELSFDIINLGASDHSVDVSSPCGEFIVVGGGPTVIPGLGSLTVTVQYAPLSGGSHVCTIDTGNVLAADVLCSGQGTWGDIDYALSTASSDILDTVRIFTLPNGQGKPFTQAQRSDGSFVDATITVTVYDTNGDPIAGIPGEEFQLVSSAGGLNACCAVGIPADGPTDELGVTTFSHAVHAGHNSIGETLQVYISGIPLQGPTMGIEFVSADMDTNCKVDLADVGRFASILTSFVYDPAADYFWDGHINLSDVGLLAAGLGAVCGLSEREVAAVPGRWSGSLGLFGDAAGTRSRAAAEPGEVFELYLMLKGAHPAGDISGWECRVDLPENVELVECTLAGQGLNVAAAPEFVVGLGEALPAGSAVRLATLRCRALDGAAAVFDLRPPQWSSVGGDWPAVISGGELQTVGIHRDAIDGVALTLNAEGTKPTPTLPDRLASLSIVPNPFNPQTLIAFELSSAERVRLAIYDVNGRWVTTLIDEPRTAGRHELLWQGRDQHGRSVASGVYFCRMETALRQETRRMTLLK